MVQNVIHGIPHVGMWRNLPSQSRTAGRIAAPPIMDVGHRAGAQQMTGVGDGMIVANVPQLSQTDTLMQPSIPCPSVSLSLSVIFASAIFASASSKAFSNKHLGLPELIELLRHIRGLAQRAKAD